MSNRSNSRSRLQLSQRILRWLSNCQTCCNASRLLRLGVYSGKRSCKSTRRDQGFRGIWDLPIWDFYWALRQLVKMCSKTCFWQTRWKFHAVGQEGCKSKSRAQQLLSYCNAFSGISVESLWVWVKPDLNPKCGSNCSCHRILTVVSVHQCATRSCQVKNGSRQSILLVRQSISESWSQRFRA